MVFTSIVIAILIISIVIFINLPKFGKLPTDEDLQRIQNSPNYKNGRFQNTHHTPNLVEGVSFYTVLKDFFFNKSKRSKPAAILPSKKTDLLSLPPDQNFVVWFGHSSYFLQVDGRRILVDPVFSGSASPIKATTKSFAGSDVYTVDEMPTIDYLFITHDHWDHLDYETVVKLKSKVKRVITGLGVARHLKYWGYDSNNIIEKNWHDEVVLEKGFIVNTTCARHFSGRSFKRDQSIWSSFVLTTPTMKIYLGGDSGYDTHFEKIGNEYGPFDVAILECGQYNPNWRYIHMLPEEVIRAATDLKAVKLLPVHWAKFSLALHAWDEPIIRVTAEAKQSNMPIITPMIGEAINLNSNEVGSHWWEGLE